MNRNALVRGVQIVVAITLATFSWFVYRDLRDHAEGLAPGLAHLNPGWLFVACALALQEGVCGGLRMFVLCRVLDRTVKLRAAVSSEFVLMFVAGVTPGQLGAPVSQAAVLVQSGMRVADAATAEIVTAFCTVAFFLATAVALLVLRYAGLLAVEGAERLDWLLVLSGAVFGSVLVVLLLCASRPAILKTGLRVALRVLGPLGRKAVDAAATVDALRSVALRARAFGGTAEVKLMASVEHLHAGFAIYRERGKAAVLAAVALTFGFFFSRFSAAYFILLGLGISPVPRHFVAHGPHLLQVVQVQALLNFALYLSPTPGASGIAEAGSAALMAPWVVPPFELPYLVLWRLITLFLGMFVGGVIVFRYLGADVLEQRAREVEESREVRTSSP